MTRSSSSLCLSLLALLLVVVPSTVAQTVLSVGNNYITGTAGSFVNCTFAVPSSYTSGWDLAFIARPALLATTNPSNAEVDLFVTATGISYGWASTATGPDAVLLNSQIPAAGRFSSSDFLALGGPLPVTAAGTVTLTVSVWFRTGSSAINASISVSSSARIQYDWTQPFNTYTGSLLLDQVQMFEYPIPFPQGCTNGAVNCTEEAHHLPHDALPRGLPAPRCPCWGPTCSGCRVREAMLYGSAVANSAHSAHSLMRAYSDAST